jgi:hypothetical protein
VSDLTPREQFDLIVTKAIERISQLEHDAGIMQQAFRMAMDRIDDLEKLLTQIATEDCSSCSSPEIARQRLDWRSDAKC